MVTTRTIRIDEEVWKALKNMADPFEDSPNDVLRKVLNLNGHHPRNGTDSTLKVPYADTNHQLGQHSQGRARGTKKRVRSQYRKPDNAPTQGELVRPLCKVLQELGGKAYKTDAEKAIFRQFENIFSDPYYQEIISEGIPRWNKDVQWARNHAKDQGLIKPPSQSGRGFWELTRKGWEV